MCAERCSGSLTKLMIITVLFQQIWLKYSSSKESPGESRTSLSEAQRVDDGGKVVWIWCEMVLKAQLTIERGPWGQMVEPLEKLCGRKRWNPHRLCRFWSISFTCCSQPMRTLRLSNGIGIKNLFSDLWVCRGEGEANNHVPDRRLIILLAVWGMQPPAFPWWNVSNLNLEEGSLASFSATVDVLASAIRRSGKQNLSGFYEPHAKWKAALLLLPRTPQPSSTLTL